MLSLLICALNLRTAKKYFANYFHSCSKLSSKLYTIQIHFLQKFSSNILLHNIILFTSDEHSTKVKSFMLDILCPLICESDMVASELLDIILINIVEPNKSQRKNAYSLAKDLILKCSNTLEPYIQSVSTSIK